MLTHHQANGEVPSRVVVLGGQGFIGSALLGALARSGVPTVAPRRPDLDLAADGAEARLAALLRPADSVVFLAAVTPDKGRGLGPFLDNVRMGAAVCTAFQAVTPAHVVYLSSDAVYPMDVGLVRERSCAQPADLYGTMHLAREVMVKTTTPAPVAVLRPTLVYGAADTHNSYGPNRLRRMARKDGRMTLFGAGEETRDHIAVDDVARLVLLVLHHRSAGTLNLATGRSISYAELAEKVAALFDPRPEVVHAPRQVPVTHRHFDVSALHRAFPTFVFTPLEEGLALAHREMLEQG